MARRRSIRRTPAATGLPVAALHYFANGELLPQAEGEQQYGSQFNWLDCYTPEAHPSAFQTTWETHRAAIEAHARVLGDARPAVDCARAAWRGELTMQMSDTEYARVVTELTSRRRTPEDDDGVWHLLTCSALVILSAETLLRNAPRATRERSTALVARASRGMSDLEVRVMSEGTDSAGGFTVPDIVASQFIDRMRNALVVQRAGAQIVPMTSDTLNIARLASGPTLAWKSENAAITAGDLMLERVQFTARTLPVLVKMSVELQEDSTNIDAVIERNSSAALAGEVDRVALRGTGTPPEPKGVRNPDRRHRAEHGHERARRRRITTR